MMSLWDALRMNMMISYQELVRTFLNFFIAVSGLRLTRAGGRIYSSVTGYAELSAPFDSTDTCNPIWHPHAADAVFRSFPML